MWIRIPFFSLRLNRFHLKHLLLRNTMRPSSEWTILPTYRYGLLNTLAATPGLQLAQLSISIWSCCVSRWSNCTDVNIAYDPEVELILFWDNPEGSSTIWKRNFPGLFAYTNNSDSYLFDKADAVSHRISDLHFVITHILKMYESLANTTAVIHAFGLAWPIAQFIQGYDV